ncbi:MAG: hypothetical protein J6W75_04110 [Bacteroidaceae bacterium]|nr:hypothetical protein [Bacteroidaceae bacterium]
MKKTAFFFFLLITLPAFSASVLRQAREALKKRSNLEQTAKNLLAEAVKPGTLHADRVECYQLAAECSQRINEAENVKLYLKQPYDTVKFFSSIFDMYQYIQQADSVTCLPDEKGRVKILNRKKNHDLLLRYRPNLWAGANWFFRHDQMAKAYSIFNTYINIVNHPLFEGDKTVASDENLPMANYLAALAAYRSNNYDGLIKYSLPAKQAGQENELIQELLVRAWESKGDTVQWERELWNGMREYPHHAYFFTRLIDHLFLEDQLDKGLAVADSLIQLDPSVPLYWYAKSQILIKQHKDAEVIVACDSCLARDSNYVDALYNKGIAALNLAVIHTENACTDVTNPQSFKDQQRIRELYQLAKQPMERVRELQPEAKDRWAAPLYRVYLNLNMGKEFDEMDRILNGN